MKMLVEHALCRVQRVKARPHRARSRCGAAIELHLVKSIVLATPNVLCIATLQCRTLFYEMSKETQYRKRIWCVPGIRREQQKMTVKRIPVCGAGKRLNCMHCF